MALYDPNEFPETETGVDFTLADVLAWARSKPADEAYDYGDFKNCAVCRFLRDSGRCDDPAVSSNHWRDRKRRDGGGHHYFDNRIRLAAKEYPTTFDAFADRLEKALS